MKMAATPYAFFLHSTSFALSSILQLIYLSFREYHWLAIMLKYQTEKMNDDEKSLFLQNNGPTTQTH